MKRETKGLTYFATEPPRFRVSRLKNQAKRWFQFKLPDKKNLEGINSETGGGKAV